MKNFAVVVVWAVLFALFQLLMNCAEPLETTRPVAPDTVVVLDTVIISEPPETVIVVDTLFFMDTVIVVLPDSGSSATFCARLSAHQPEIVWLLLNEAGQYLLQFEASAEQSHPEQVLVVEIDGSSYQWYPAETAEYTIEVDLERHATIRITTIPPHAFGHAIDICLVVTPL